MDWDTIRRAACQITNVELEEIVDQPFKLLKHNTFNTYIDGPATHRYDVDTIRGVDIWFGITTVSCRFYLFLPIKGSSCEFEYADPAFPENLIRLVESSLINWMCWWDTEEVKQIATMLDRNNNEN